MVRVGHSLVAHRFGSLGFVVGLEVVHRHLDRVLLEFLENHPKSNRIKNIIITSRKKQNYSIKEYVRNFTFPGLPGNPGGPKFVTLFTTLMLKKGYKCKPGGPDGETPHPQQ